MPIIKPKSQSEKQTIRIKIDAEILQDIKQYCAYAGFKKPDDFFEEAAIYILSKDKEFKEHRDSKTAQEDLA